MSDHPSPTEIVEAAEKAKALGLTDGELVTTPFKTEEDKGKSLDWCVEKYKDKPLVSIIFEKEDDDGFHIFNVTWNKVLGMD
jgi:hypothetical protein